MKPVEHTICPANGKRTFASRERARKALGKAQARHVRRGGGQTRRGTVRENRVYECPTCRGWHLTHRSRSEYMEARQAWAEWSAA